MNKQYKIKYDATLKNRLTNEVVKGNIVNERDIEGKVYWVIMSPDRGQAHLSYSKESWLLTKGK